MAFDSFLLLIFSSHPLINVLTNKKYSAGNKNTLYEIVDAFSVFSTNIYTIISSYLFAVFMILFNLPILGIPLIFVSWIVTIRDRFRSLSRGMGAPGYFCFLSNLILFLSCLKLNIDPASNNFNLYSLFLEILFSIAFIEIAFIFLSAGLFKLLDSYRNPHGFCLGIQNPIWSKIFMINFNNNIREILNFIGIFLQIIAGSLIIIGNETLKIYGFLIIAFMFLPIMPFCRLGWLCASISVLSLFSIKLIPIYNSLNPTLNILIILIRSSILFILFYEYFNSNKFPIKSIHNLFYPYRYLFGINIWRVFTFNVIKFVSNRSLRNWPKYFKVKSKNNYIKIKRFLFLSTKTNVYDSITITSLLSSRKYLSEAFYQKRLYKYCSLYGLSQLTYLELSIDNLNEDLFRLNPFVKSNIFTNFLTDRGNEVSDDRLSFNDYSPNK